MPTSTRTLPVRAKKVFHKTKLATSQLRANLQSGVYPPGYLNKTEVARELGINDQTLKSAFVQMAKEGLLEQREHKGNRSTYYVPEPASAPVNPLTEARASLALDGETQSYGTLADVIAATIRTRLATGEYPVGSRLPSQTALAAELGTNQPAVWRGISILKDEGLLRGGPGHYAEVIALPRQPAKPAPQRSAVETAQALAVKRLDSPGTSPETAVPKRQKVSEHLKKAILSGELPAHSVLPSRETLAANLVVGRSTIDYAMARLEGWGLVAIQPDHRVVVLPESERGSTRPEPAERYSAPTETLEQGALIPANEVMPIIQVLYDENRRLMKVEATSKEVGTRLAGYEEEIKRLRGEVAQWRGTAHRTEEENAELRGRLHRQGQGNGTVIRSFGPEFKNSLGMSDTDADRIKGLLKTKQLMETPRER